MSGWPVKPLPASGRRLEAELSGYVYGRTATGEYGIDYQITVLEHHGLKGVFLVEPLFAAVTVIRHNRFVKLAPPRADSLSRPSVLLGHFPRTGPGAQDRYLVHHNVFHGNPMPGEALFQGEGNIVLECNVFLAPHGDAIRIQPHNDIPREVTITRNVVLAAGTGVSLRLGPGSEAHVQRVMHNLIHAREPVAGVHGPNVTGPPEAAGFDPAADPALLLERFVACTPPAEMGNELLR